MPKKTVEVFEIVVFRFVTGWMAAAACKRLQSIILSSEGNGTTPNEVVFRVRQGVAPLLIGQYLHPYGVLVDAYEIDSDENDSNW